MWTDNQWPCYRMSDVDSQSMAMLQNEWCGQPINDNAVEWVMWSVNQWPFSEWVMWTANQWPCYRLRDVDSQSMAMLHNEWCGQPINDNATEGVMWTANQWPCYRLRDVDSQSMAMLQNGWSGQSLVL